MKSIRTRTAMSGPSAMRNRLLTTVVTGLTLAGIITAVVSPPWLTHASQALVERAGAAAPLMYVLLCALTAPMHLNGVLVALSSLLWPLPVALALSFIGSLFGCVFTAALLKRVGMATFGGGTAWPAWLQRLAAYVTRRPLLIGLVVRIVGGSGMALEVFYLLTGYTRQQYLIVTTLGLAVWVTQALVGVTVLHALLQRSAWLAIAFAAVPILLLPSILALYRYRRRRDGLTKSL